MSQGRQPSTMVLPFGKATRVIHAGGYYNRPATMYGIKMAKEIKTACDMDIPTVDFSIPPEKELKEGIKKALWQLANNKEVYVGCMGGIGRTGLFLGILVRTLGESDPVTYVRSNYYGHAIETEEQREYVTTLDLGSLPTLAKGAKIYARLRDFI